MDDRAKLEAVAKSYHDLMAFQKEQREIIALLLRACTARLKSPDSRKRAEAIKGLDELATMLEGK